MHHFIELTGIAFRKTDDEYHYTFFINVDNIASYHPNQWGCQVFETGSNQPFEVCEDAGTIDRRIRGEE